MDDPHATPETPILTPKGPRKARIRLGAVFALAIGAGLGAWAIVGSRDSDSPSSEPSAATTPATTTATVKPIAPVGLSAQGLRTLTSSIPEPVYWAGPKPGYLYELTRTSAGKIFIRYLPSGTPVGTKKATYLIVATYPFQDALKAITDLPGKRQVKIPAAASQSLTRITRRACISRIRVSTTRSRSTTPPRRAPSRWRSRGSVRPVSP